jgi:hypothetical protein
MGTGGHKPSLVITVAWPFQWQLYVNRRPDTHEVETADIAEAFEESAVPCIHKGNLRYGLEYDPPQPAHTVTAD